MKNPGGRPRKLESPEQLQEMIDSYLKLWEENPEVEEVPCIEGFCLHAKIGRTTYYEYEKNPKFTDTVEGLRLFCVRWLKNKSMFGKVNPTIAGRLLGAYGVKEKQETTVEHKGEGLSITVKKATE